MNKKIVLCLIFLVYCLTAQPGIAKIFQSIDKTYQTDSTPLDVATSPDGKYTFVLTANGKVNIYESAGKKGEITVPSGFDRISSSTTGDEIWLVNPKDKKVQGIFLDFIQNIETEGSPFLGNEQAPVAVVVFSDFQ